MPHLLKGGYSEGVSSRVDVYSIRQPLGVVAIISPFNFPAMVPCWFFPIAIAAGNTVVLKPSEKDPSAANWLAELWAEAGLPAGVFNVVHGDKVAVDRLLEHPDVQGGVVRRLDAGRALRLRDRDACTASACRRSAARRTTWSCCPTPTSTSRPTPRSTPASARRASGAWRSRSSSRSARSATGSSPKIAERIGGLTVGDGRDGADMGPLITRAHLDRVVVVPRRGRRGRRRSWSSTAASARSRGDADRLLARARRCSTTSRRRWTLYTDEIFGPGAVGRCACDSYDDALALVNANPYGNGTAIFTNDGGAARRFQNEVEVGMVGINVPIPVPVAYYSFGGWKSSLFGDTHAYGADGVHFFTRAQGRHQPLARPEPRRRQPRLPAEHVDASSTKGSP